MIRNSRAIGTARAAEVSCAKRQVRLVKDILARKYTDIASRGSHNIAFVIKGLYLIWHKSLDYNIKIESNFVQGTTNNTILLSLIDIIITRVHPWTAGRWLAPLGRY